MIRPEENIRVQKYIVGVAVFLFIIKMTAWYLTQSVAILTDGLESIVNMVSGFVGLYSLMLSAKPRDSSHPYGHGKVEFISAGIEGTLITMAGLYIIYEAIHSFLNPRLITRLDTGILLVLFSGLINYAFGMWAVKTGARNESLALKASGRHLQSDTYTTVGIVAGLVFLRITGLNWIDGAIAIIFACVILYTGFKILRSAVAGIMDESDEQLLEEMVSYLEQNRDPRWVDLHNLRIIKYGSVLHVDCHLTVPWYFNVRQAHDEVDRLEDIVRKKFGNRIELFVHTDYCKEFSCRLCQIQGCEVRQHPFEERVEWTVENLTSKQKHHLHDTEGN